MPAALSTTKRKFHQILDSISNASSTSLATSHGKYNASTITLPANMDPPAKKSRIARPTSTFGPPIARATAVLRPSTGVSKVMKQAASSETLEGKHKTPNFAPWDRRQFLERLQTYRHVDKWMGKPEKINEVKWAKRGWSCIGKDRVGCVGGCAKEVVITLESSRIRNEDEEERLSDDEAYEDEWREKAQEALVEKYVEMIVTSHDEGCLWRRRGCDDTIQRLPLAHRTTAIGGLRHRYESLVAMPSELPFDPSTPEDFDVSKTLVQTASLLCASPMHPPDGAQHILLDSCKPSETDSPLQFNTSALTLALFGWEVEEGHVSGLATCKACFRRLGLWLFKSPSTKTNSQSSMERLDVIGEHRDYCPWINALSQNGTASRRSSLDGLAGWQVLLRAVNVSITDRKREFGATSVTLQDMDDVASEVASVTSLATTSRERKNEEERDKERWAKLKRLKQVFQVKRGKGKEQFRQSASDVAR
ncbi:hypothetical protein N7G274_002498 [Stereocaulon virgatum]|uniref:Zf-C3HC-domain-containing protein n=1 Tax=Stereocaulon virgatum TaxID=373712 RepID=A0ABR4AGT2_9LECA